MADFAPFGRGGALILLSGSSETKESDNQVIVQKLFL